jgi:outer membrane protein assembly factor BamB
LTTKNRGEAVVERAGNLIVVCVAAGFTPRLPARSRRAQTAAAMRKWLVPGLSWLAALPVLAADGGFVFEDLGEPVRVRGLAMECVTRDPAGGFMAWGAYEAPDKNALVGVHLGSGEVTWVETTRFGRTHIQLFQADGDLYAYTGSPGHFLKYDAAQHGLADLGVPANPASYWLGNAVGPDGKFYVGTYPQACLVRCDPRTGRIENLGRLPGDPKQCYLLYPVVSPDNVVYCPVGLHHQELWALDINTGAKKQILPDLLTRAQGNPRVWLAADGHVYGESGSAKFRCHPDRVEMGETQPAAPRQPLMAGEQMVGSINAAGRLALTDVKTRKVSLLETRYEGAPRSIFSVSCERDGVVYGGTFSPAISFACDTRTGKLTNFGELAVNKTQVYDTLNHASGLFLSSYMPASVDFFDPARPIHRPDNPRPVVSVAGQERPVQLRPGPDGMIYSGTFPSKGRLGGALVRVNPDDFTCKVWTHVITNQSIFSLIAVPELGGLFCSSSIHGGSSAIPAEKEACVFLWDCRRETVVFRAQPVAGTKQYGAVARARNGLVYGIAGAQYYAFDPAQRKAVFTGTLPVKGLCFPELSHEPAGPRGLIYGIGDGAVFAIDPADHRAKIVARDDSLKRAYGFFVTQDETLYYGCGSRLMRCRLRQ